MAGGFRKGFGVRPGWELDEASITGESAVVNPHSDDILPTCAVSQVDAQYEQTPTPSSPPAGLVSASHSAPVPSRASSAASGPGSVGSGPASGPGYAGSGPVSGPGSAGLGPVFDLGSAGPGPVSGPGSAGPDSVSDPASAGFGFETGPASAASGLASDPASVEESRALAGGWSPFRPGGLKSQVSSAITKSHGGGRRGSRQWR